MSKDRLTDLDRLSPLVSMEMDRSALGDGHVLLISSPVPGMERGIFSTINNLVEAKNFNMAHSRCNPKAAMRPYSPIIDMIEKMVKNRFTDTAGLRKTVEDLPEEMVGILPSLRDFRSSWGGFDYLNEQMAFEEVVRSGQVVFQGFCRLLRAFSRENLLILILEDVQWSDASTLKLVHWLSGEMQDSKLLIILTYDSVEVASREDGFIQGIEDMKNDDRITSILLKESKKSKEQSILPGKAPSTNPLDNVEKRVLGYMAVIGPLLDLPLLSRVSAVDEKRTKKIMQELEAKGFISVEEGRRITFIGTSPGDMASKLFSKEELVQAHKQVADSIGWLHGEKIEEHLYDVVFHYMNAGNAEMVVEYSIKAGDMAASTFAPHLALSYYEKALENLPEEGSHSPARNVPQRLWLLKKIIDMSYIIGEWDMAIEYCQQLSVLCIKKGDKKELARVQFKLGDIYEKRGLFEEAYDVIDMAAIIFEENGNLEGVADCNRLFGDLLRKQGSVEEAIERYGKGIEFAEKLGDKSLLGRLFDDMGNAHKERGDYELAEKNLLESVRLLEGSGDKMELVRSYNNLGVLYFLMEKPEEALDMFEKQLKLAKDIGYSRLEASGYYNMAGLLARTKKDRESLEKAEQYCTRAMEISTKLGDKHMISASHRAFGQIYTKKWDWQKARHHFQKSLDIMKKAGEKYYLAESYYELGLMYRKQGDRERAFDHLREAKKIWARMGSVKRAREVNELIEELLGFGA
ncbi:MAG: tetratricopeptide repeat protein [Candidatus Thermoplasmatota archaeon]|nr:tetratricopeptide repeat protein [Candidatus Thermoplasmatota archaeon]